MIATTFEAERRLYGALRTKLVSVYPASVFLLLADGRMVGVFPTVKEADEHARLQRFRS